MEASARDGLWSVRRRNVSARSILLCLLLAVDPFKNNFDLIFEFFFQHRYRQLSCRRDLGRDSCDKDGHTCIREANSCEARTA
jgi:hypothetical protein